MKVALFFLLTILSFTLNSQDHFQEFLPEIERHEAIYQQDEYNSYEILTEKDLNEEFLHRLSNQPEMSSAMNAQVQWKSFNKWSCYSIAVINVSCIEGYNKALIPTIEVALDNETRDFDFDREDGSDDFEKCENVLVKWKSLFEGEEELCIYAAYLQELEFGENPHTLWIAQYLKTKKGYWKLWSEDENENEKIIDDQATF